MWPGMSDFVARGNDDRELAPDYIKAFGQFFARAALHLLMELGELAADTQQSIAQYLCRISQECCHPMWRLEENHRVSDTVND